MGSLDGSMGREGTCSLVTRPWMPSQGQWNAGGLCQLRPDQMKALENALDVHIGKRECFEGEARTPRRGQGLEEPEAEEGWGRADLSSTGKRGLVLSYVPIPPPLARPVSPSFWELVGISQAPQ